MIEVLSGTLQQMLSRRLQAVEKWHVRVALAATHFERGQFADALDELANADLLVVPAATKRDARAGCVRAMGQLRLRRYDEALESLLKMQD